MAFVADPTEEELQRALALQGAPPTAPGGLVGAPTGGGAPVGPSTPQGSAPTVAPGAEQGTGFVNLSRYFDANSSGAEKMAQGLMDPLKVNTQAIGDAAAAGVKMPAAPVPYVEDPYNPAGTDVWNGGSTGGPTPSEIDATNLSDYQKALAQAKQQAEVARQRAIQDAASTNIQTARGLVSDPLKRDEALSVDGKNPSAFDSYLTGAAIQPAYQGLRDYYGVSGPRDPAAPPDPGTRGDRPPPPAKVNPGRPGSGGSWSSTTPPPESAATSMDPQLRKRSQNAGGW